MWLPLTSRTCARAVPRTTWARTSATQGPAALTSARAVDRSPLARRRVLERELPQVRLPARPTTQRVRGSMLAPRVARVERVQHHQARILDPAVGIFEAVAIRRLAAARRRDRSARSSAARRRQALAAAEMVVEEQPEPQHPGAGAGRDDAAARNAAAR